VYLSHEVACCHISCFSCIFVYLTHWSPSLLCSNVCLNQFVPLSQGTLFSASSMQELSEPVGPHTWMNRSQCLFLQSRGAEIYAEFLGGSFTCDAYHMTEPHPDGIWGFPCSYSTWIVQIVMAASYCHSWWGYGLRICEWHSQGLTALILVDFVLVLADLIKWLALECFCGGFSAIS
jgi:hypothetical protein